MKKLLTIFLCMVLLLLLAQVVFAVETPDFSAEQAAIISEFNELSQAQAGAVAAHDALVKVFWPDAYPENYGGTYIEDNLLHINIVNLEHQDLTPYETVLTDHLDVVRFVDVDYSMYTLRQAMEPIWEHLQSLGVHVFESGVSSRHNAVTIGITQDSVAQLPTELVLDAPSFYTPFQVPVLVTVGEIPTLLTGDAVMSAAPPTLPAFVPVFGCALLVLAVGVLLVRRRNR